MQWVACVVLMHLPFTAGAIPTSITSLTKLTTLTLHANLLTGTVPSFSNLTWLVNLTLFKNTNLGGTLDLPLVAPLQTVITFKNRLSCEMKGVSNVSIYNNKYHQMFGRFASLQYDNPYNPQLMTSAACLYHTVGRYSYCAFSVANRSVGLNALLLPGALVL